MKPEYILAGWHSFRRATIPIHATPEQLRQLKMAFFGGASFLLSAVMRKLSTGEEITEADLQMMRDVQTELTAFAESCRKGIVP